MNRIILKNSAWLTPLATGRNSLKSIKGLSTRISNSSVSTKRLSSSSVESYERCLTFDNVNPNLKNIDYAPRGAIPGRASEIEKELKNGTEKPFSEVIYGSIGDAQSMGQKPLTYVRQLLALLFNPCLLESNSFPEDIKQRAREILDDCRGNSIGAYTDSLGIPVIRKQVAKFIEERDCVPCDWNNIYLTTGASLAIQIVITLMCAQQDGKPAGIMVSVPQFPLYAITALEHGMEKVYYYLDEDNNWSLNICELQRAFDEAKCICNPRTISVINPGNPTGQVLTRENIEEVIQFAYKNKLVIMADEVYQHNIHDPNSKFYSFKSVMYEMGAPYRDMELFSFMSTSKGYIGECGLRGGLMEAVNLCPKVVTVLRKALSTTLCANTAGQAAVSALVNPPQSDEPSYEQFIAERTCNIESLRERAQVVNEALSSLEGFKINLVQGAMYAFPLIEIPPKAIAAARAKNMAPDTFYAFELLEATGVCVINGSGFGQKPGTYHFRTTILPPTDKIKIMMEKIRDFHGKFIEKYK